MGRICILILPEANRKQLGVLFSLPIDTVGWKGKMWYEGNTRDREKKNVTFVINSSHP